MKIGSYKFIARKKYDKIQIAYKSETNLFTVTNTSKSVSFTFYAARDFVQVTLMNDKKHPYLELVYPSWGQKFKLKLTDGDAYKKFLETDYNGRIFKS